MKNKAAKRKLGIHTFELYANNLKYSQVQKVVDFLMDSGEIQILKSDPFHIDRSMKSTYFVEEGIRMRIYQSHNRSNGIGFIINPSTFLSGEYQPVQLWEPSPAKVERLLEELSKVLKKIGLEDLPPESLSLSQLDLTINFLWEGRKKFVPLFIHGFWKGMLPKHFKRYPIKDKKLKKHLFIMQSGAATYKAYDKIYELTQNHRCPEKLKEMQILRLEISMKREAFLKKLKLDRKDSLYKMLRTGYLQTEEILLGYMGKIIPNGYFANRYQETKFRIEKSVSDKKLREQMLYLLKKTSDSAGLDTAALKLKKYYKNVDHRRLKKILDTFTELQSSPITLPEDWDT